MSEFEVCFGVMCVSEILNPFRKVIHQLKFQIDLMGIVFRGCHAIFARASRVICKDTMH